MSNRFKKGDVLYDNHEQAAAWCGKYMGWKRGQTLTGRQSPDGGWIFPFMDIDRRS